MYRDERDCLVAAYGTYSGDITYLMVLVKLNDWPGKWEQGADYWKFIFEDGAQLTWWMSNSRLTVEGRYGKRIVHADELTATFHQFGDDVAEFLDCDAPPEFDFSSTSFAGGEYK